VRNVVGTAARFALAHFPDGFKARIRAVMPLRAKRWLGAEVMAGVAHDRTTVSVPDGRIFRVIEDRLFLRVLYERDYEPQLSAIVKTLLRPKDTAVDVGANFGWYTTLLAACADSGLVVSYEPTPHSYSILTENIRLNHLESRVRARNTCVGDQDGFVAFDVDSTKDSGLGHIVDDPGTSAPQVPIVKLSDDLEQFRGSIAYMKVDVEGHELAVLRGASELLDVPNQPLLQLEVNDSALDRGGASRGALLEFLRSRGYVFWETGPHGQLRRTDATGGSDVFCAGQGRYADRIRDITGMPDTKL
jgi:FkbM family methyltransferase